MKYPTEAGSEGGKDPITEAPPLRGATEFIRAFYQSICLWEWRMAFLPKIKALRTPPLCRSFVPSAPPWYFFLCFLRSSMCLIMWQAYFITPCFGRTRKMFPPYGNRLLATWHLPETPSSSPSGYPTGCLIVPFFLRFLFCDFIFLPYLCVCLSWLVQN